jgi:hypothetical protein
MVVVPGSPSAQNAVAHDLCDLSVVGVGVLVELNHLATTVLRQAAGIPERDAVSLHVGFGGGEGFFNMSSDRRL